MCIAAQEFSPFLYFLLLETLTFTCTICTGMLASLAAFFKMWASSTNILRWGADQSLNMGHSGSSQISIDLHIILHPLLHHPFTNICILTSKFMLENIYYWPHHHRSAFILPVHKVVTLNAREGSSKVKVICLEKKIWFLCRVAVYDYCSRLQVRGCSVTQIIGRLWPFEKKVFRKYFVIQLVHLVNVSRVRDELACPHLP